tara:strand:+ start:5804 stop:6838 length:1035 start_codon:yes stop_codon:yes gene_type:complete
MDFNFKRVFIVAELSANHGGDINIAIDSIKAAKKSGADAIKLQTYTPNTMTIDSKKKDFIVNGGSIWDGQTFFDLYEKAHTPWEWHFELFKVAREEGLEYFSTPFDKKAVDLLEELDNPIYKIASFEINDIPLIKYVASKGKPMILSTGVATIEDIKLALDTIRAEGNNQIALLKCTSSYPAPINEANLLMIRDFKQKFKVVTGLSDHTISNTSAIVATSLGAKIIEKHFILDKSIGGPDASFSLDAKEFSNMVNAVRETESAIGEIDYELTKKQKLGKIFSRSLYVVKDSNKGEIITDENIRSIRPGFGGHPKYLDKLIGKQFKNNFKRGDRFTNDDIKGHLK